MAESESDDFASAESDTEDLLQTEVVGAGDLNVEEDGSSPKQDEAVDSSTGSPSDKNSSDTEREQLPSTKNEAQPPPIPPTETPPLSDTPSGHVADSPKTDPSTAVETPTPTDPPSDSDTSKGASEEGKKGAESDGWGGWGGWGGSLWSSVSTVAGSAQAIGQKVTAVIASVEDSLGVPSPEELAQKETEGSGMDQETCRLADEIKEHDVSPEDLEPVREEPHHQDVPAPAGREGSPRATDGLETGEKGEESNYRAVSGFFSGFAAAVQTTGQGLVSGGLDALETLGKKTMEVLSEGDPGLTKKRAMLGVGSSPTLSQLLKEAKSEVASRAVEGGDLDLAPLPLNYSRLFDEYHGVNHLEALELLSKECAGKTHSSLGGLAEGDLQSVQDNWGKLSQAFAIDEEQDNLEDDSSQLDEVKELFADITLPLKVDKLIKVSSGWREKVDGLGLSESDGGEGDDQGESKGEPEGDGEQKCGLEDKEEKEDNKSGEVESKESTVGGKVLDKAATSEVLYENGLRSLAELTSTAIELFRKMAEVSLLPDVSKSGALQQAQKFNRLTVLVSNELDALASVHSEAITLLDLEGTNAKVTSLYLESSNSGSYVQDAFQLLLPVLKLSMLQQLQTQEPELNVLNRN